MIVPDGFSWPAFAYTVLWFLFHRLWVAALIVLAGLAAVAFAGYALASPARRGRGIALLASVPDRFRGVEPAPLDLARRGFALRDAVVARDSAEPRRGSSPAGSIPRACRRRRARPFRVVPCARRAGDRPVPGPRRRR